MTTQFQDKTFFITGASRGIGREIALKLAANGANIVITGKTAEPHPKLDGTIHSVAEEVEQAGGQALAIQLDVRNDEQIYAAVKQTVQRFGGIDGLINNASAISLTPTSKTAMKRYDLMQSVNARATYACSQACLPFLINAENPHILTMSPPLSLEPKWFKDHLAYTISKYGMSFCTLGLAEEFKTHSVAVNSLWPKTAIATAAIAANFPEAIYKQSRKPAIMADAALHILGQPSDEVTGNFYIDEEVLRESGLSDFAQYAITPGGPLFPDLFVD